MSTADIVPCSAAEKIAAVDQPEVGLDPSTSDASGVRVKEALALWLKWNDVFEKATAAMFERRLNLQQLHDSMDQADELRRKAVQLSQELLDD